jgi:hypothetical protein
MRPRTVSKGHRSCPPPEKNTYQRRNERPRKTPRHGVILVFTGDRRKNRFRVDVAGKPVLLQGACFRALVKLVVSGIDPGTGLAGVRKQTIRSLRCALGAERWLIATGGRQEYRLAIPRDEILMLLGVTPCFFELVSRRVVTAEAAEILRRQKQL